jgi:DNA topoisomerase VI subunit A
MMYCNIGLEVIEKQGIFARLVEDNFFRNVPSILVCGRGYPSVATRAMVFLMAEQLR